VVHSMIKEPRQGNYAGAMNSRIEAFRGMSGVAARTDSLLNDGYYPQIEIMCKARGWWTMNDRIRYLFIEEFAKWVDFPGATPAQSIIGMVMRLGKDHGMTHIKLIASFINDTREILEMMRGGLDTEIQRFVLQYTQLEAQVASHLMPYSRLIAGSRNMIMRQRDFPELYKLARWYGTLISASFAAYAGNTEKSGFQNEFESVARTLGILLPSLAARSD